MDGRTLIFVVLSGLCFLPACFPRGYVFVNEKKTWAEAQAYCRRKYIDLASFDSKEELDRLGAEAKNYYPHHVWIGLYDDINSWRWSLENESYYGEGEAEFRMWIPGEPDNGRGYENCAAMIPNGMWVDVVCTYEFRFACYNGSAEAVGSSSIVLVSEERSWRDAQSYCREHYTDLASVRNQTENDWMKNMTQEQKLWIGFYRDSWKWSDGSPSSFREWKTINLEPRLDSACVALHEGQWKNMKCHEKSFFVCSAEQVRLQVVKVKLTIKNSSVKQEDTAEDVLQQLQQRLKDHGLSKDIRLTWRKQPDGKIFH